MCCTWIWHGFDMDLTWEWHGKHIVSICVTAVPRSGGLLCRSGSWASEWFVLSPESPGRQRCTAPENTNGLELMDISIFPWICECFWGIWCRSPPARVPKLKSASVLPQLLQYRRRKRRGTGGLRTAELLRLKEFTKSTCRYGFVHYAAIHCYSVLPSIASRFAVEISKEASGCEGCEARVKELQNCKEWIWCSFLNLFEDEHVWTRQIFASPTPCSWGRQLVTKFRSCSFGPTTMMRRLAWSF